MKIKAKYGLPAACVKPRTANFDAVYAKLNSWPAQLRIGVRRVFRTALHTLFPKQGGCADYSPALTLFDHLHSSVLVAEEGSFRIDVHHVIPLGRGHWRCVSNVQWCVVRLMDSASWRFLQQLPRLLPSARKSTKARLNRLMRIGTHNVEFTVRMHHLFHYSTDLILQRNICGMRGTGSPFRFDFLNELPQGSQITGDIVDRNIEAVVR